MLRLTRFAETVAYFSPAHGYSLQVSFLGLFPILMSSNEPLKKEAIAKLEAGGLFAFAVSEQAHGSDLFANQFTVKPAGESGQVGDGVKYYIGNANAACMITILGKEVAADSAATTKRAPFIFFALRPQESPAFQQAQKIRTLGIRSAFVGEFEVTGHAFPESDVISRGRDAWEAVFATVTLGKFFLGFGAVGICAHALAEAYAHMHRRLLYGKRVTEMPHIRAVIAAAFARLMAMKLFAYRALDYLQAANKNDRRHLFFNAVQKAKVSIEGVKVMALLSECLGARGFEAQTYFESALREAPMIPSLESSTHINFGLTAQFVTNYFARNHNEIAPPESITLRESDPGENPYWMETGDRNAKTVRFAHCFKAYLPLRSVVNVRLFVKQVKAFRFFAEDAESSLNPSLDAGVFISIGKCISTIAYAQLVAENCVMAQIPTALVSVIFQGLIEDLGTESLKLSAMFSPEDSSRRLLRRVVSVPRTGAADLEYVSDFLRARYGA